MAIELTCPTCASRLRVGDEAAGKQIRCGKCMSVLRVPEVRPAPPPPPEPPADPPLFEMGDPYPEERPRPRREPERRPRRDDEEEPRRERDGEEPRRGRYEDEERGPPRRRRDYDDEYEEPRRRRDYDEDDEPRPRRRRRPPPPAGRGALFWVAAVFGVLLLGTCACCGGGYLLLPGENWRRHESPEGGFTVDVPGPIKKDMPIPGMKPDPNVKVEGTILWKRGEFYMVAYSDLPPFRARGAADEAALDQVVREMQSDRAIRRVVRTDRIQVSGFPAREIEYVYEDGGTYVGRVVVSDRRLYVLVGGGRFVGPGNANIRRFLDSFEVKDRGLRN